MKTMKEMKRGKKGMGIRRSSRWMRVRKKKGMMTGLNWRMAITRLRPFAGKESERYDFYRVFFFCYFWALIFFPLILSMLSVRFFFFLMYVWCFILMPFHFFLKFFSSSWYFMCLTLFPSSGFVAWDLFGLLEMKKGQAQYLIKWRGWPETANTWEPLENLLQCSDVIDAFEESMRSGKRSTRKRKRNSATTPSQTKKKKQQQQHSPAADSYSVPAVKIQIESNSLPTPVDDRTISNGEPHVTAVNDTETANTENEKGVELGANRAEETEVANELSLKISELKEAKVTNGDFVDKISLLPKESQFLDQDGLANGSQKSDCSEAIQSSRTGAKKRKSGSVKRFKLDIASDRTNGSQNVVALKGSSGLVADQGVQNADTGINDLQLKNKTENSKTICDITEIIRPVSFTSAMVNNVKDVSVTFTAKRADGKEVAVDNKFLKANHPLLLINYYEQHLKYTPQ
ncbi:OLC1v1001761C4 [Oldenlandia corymbosa var. corymbosa]|uniref:OLC1v1001761C4 n=1 Tax=Oldenlandia corymbosa var. corymbosa TaxID=529605 RepID=A0AAV1D8U3_OLDCO|nr:OLC1v1001761C4 [Oldenlandia corymbosa var. corymbosa]